MTSKWVFWLIVVAAVAMVAVSPFMEITAPRCNQLGMPPLTAFELVRSVADLQRIFGMPGDACRAAMIAQLDHANVLDTFAFIPAYAVFYVLMAWDTGKYHGLKWPTITLALICAGADVVENAAMFQLSKAPDEASPWLTTLIVATNVKWVGLAVVTALCGLMRARMGKLGRQLFPYTLAPLASSLVALVAPNAAGIFMVPAMMMATLALFYGTLIIAWRMRKEERSAQ
jgi:hypothetical protein